MSSFILNTKYFLKPNLLNQLKVNKSVFNGSGFGVRYLFTEEVLGIDSYLQTRQRIQSQFGDMKDKFFARMEEITKSDTKMIFTEDLKNVVFLSQNNSYELELMSESIKKFQAQNQSLQFGTFVFGPIVMRLLHHLSECDLALELFKDPQLKAFFSQIKSVVILMNMLYINGKYEQCLDVFDYLQNTLEFETKYPRDCLLLYIASCYKINSQQSFDLALDVLKKAREAGAMVSRKTVSLFAALALNQGQANTALEVLSLITQSNYISVRNLRFMALSELERFDDLFISLKLLLNRDVPPEVQRPEIFEETMTKIKAKIESIDDKKIQTDWSQIERGLIEGNHVTSTTLDQVMTTPVVLRTDANQMGRDRQQRGFRNHSIQQNFRRFERNEKF